MKIINEMAKETCPGVFWDIDGKLLAYPFVEGDYVEGQAKSGVTYNHKKLWDLIKPRDCSNKPYNYFPRGRVVIDNKGRPVIYMNPNVSEDLIDDIKIEFGLREVPKIHYDSSEHYKSYQDLGWRPVW